MATKSEKARAESIIEQSARKQRAAPKRRTSKGPSPKKPHNLSARAGRGAMVAYEVAGTNGPSRKSTRRGEHHQRSATQLERTKQLRQQTPEAKAARAKGRAVKVRGHR